MRDLIRRHWKQVGERVGLDLDELPKNGGMSCGVRYEVRVFTSDSDGTAEVNLPAHKSANKRIGLTPNRRPVKFYAGCQRIRILMQT